MGKVAKALSLCTVMLVLAEVVPTPAAAAEGNVAWTAVSDAPSSMIDPGAAVVGGSLYVFGGYRRLKPLTASDAINVYDSRSRSWKRLSEKLPYASSHVSTTSDGRVAYLAGGFTVYRSRPCGQYDPCEIFGTRNVWRFDPSAGDGGKLTDLPDLPEARGSGALVLVGRTLHFFGGVDTGTLGPPSYGVDRRERLEHWALDLDAQTAGWRPDVPLPAGEGRSHAGTTVVESDIYVVGGQTGFGAPCGGITTAPCTRLLSSVLRFATARPELGWQRMAALPEPRSHTAQTVTKVKTAAGARLFVGSGDNPPSVGTSTLWVYMPNAGSGTWSAGSPLPLKRYAAVLKYDQTRAKLYYTGGGPTRTSTLTYEGSLLE